MDYKNIPSKLDRLVRDSRLEEVSQAKIGTFERLYYRDYMADSRVPMYGFEDLDYATLVNLLASTLELELNKSLYQAVRRDAGVERLRIGRQEVNLRKRSQMYGTLIELFKAFRETTARVVGDADAFVDALSTIADCRNDANHTEYISKQKFLEFYRLYSGTFNRWIGALLDLKTSFVRREHRYVAPDYGAPARYDAAEDDYIRSLRDSLNKVSLSSGRHGLIFTNTKKLALKYFGDVNYAQSGQLCSHAEHIRAILKEYITQLESFGCDYGLLDLAAADYGYILDERSDWRAHLDILDDVCRKNRIDGEAPAALFIIGGNDVIPMPRFHNPAQEEQQEALELDSLDHTVDTDLPYAYGGEFVRVTAKNELSLDALSAVIGRPRFHVGRLPLEEGFMKTSLEDDLVSYLSRSLAAFADGGIAVTAPLMTTCRSTRQVGAFMVEDVPLVGGNEVPEEMSAGAMVTSPALAFNDDAKGRYQRKGGKEYKALLSRADMLVFLLHGSGVPSSSYYYGEYSDEQVGKYNPIAFGPELLAAGNIKSIATVSCFGAKFIGYDRKNSTLLSAIYRDTLCFMGSSRSALGDFDYSLACKRDRTPGWSVRLMHFYLHLLFSGVQGGEALSRARIKYMEGVTSGRCPDEGIADGLLTLQEFNFFGDPMLCLKPRISLPAGYGGVSRSLPGYYADGDGWSREYSPVNLRKNEAGSLLDRVRGLVDDSFSRIHQTIADELYRKWGIDPRDLSCVNRYRSAAGEQGYTLRYRYKDDDLVTYTVVDTDLSGKVVRLYHTY